MLLLIVHIILALGGLILMGSAIAAKVAGSQLSKRLSRASLISAAGMLVTGFGLVVTTHSSLTSACLSGLSYLAILVVLYAAYSRATARSSSAL
ncbi:MAG TPA: hypothetical protein VGS28_02265 [Candidatus Saccharimonadales bacterium]|nr:hypothetical protein [Candidatus Saccharimonadales bacterium]